jgi:hypothetical protein
LTNAIKNNKLYVYIEDKKARQAQESSNFTFTREIIESPIIILRGEEGSGIRAGKASACNSIVWKAIPLQRKRKMDWEVSQYIDLLCTDDAQRRTLSWLAHNILLRYQTASDTELKEEMTCILFCQGKEHKSSPRVRIVPYSNATKMTLAAQIEPLPYRCPGGPTQSDPGQSSKVDVAPFLHWMGRYRDLLSIDAKVVEQLSQRLESAASSQQLYATIVHTKEKKKMTSKLYASQQINGPIILMRDKRASSWWGMYEAILNNRPHERRWKDNVVR